MAKQIIYLYVHSLSPPLGSWAITANNIVLHTMVREPLTDLIVTSHQELIVIAPTQDILLTEVMLPKLKHQRLQQALPFAVEEQLIDDISALHFAIGTYSGSYWPVAIIQKKILEEWLAFFKTLNLTPKKIIPDVLALPYIEGQWSIYTLDQLCLVRTGCDSGFCCEKHNLSIYLAQPLKEESDLQHINIFTTDQPLPLLETSVLTTQHVISETDFLTHCVRGLQQHPSINLLQGLFRAKKPSAQNKKYWHYAAYVTMAWLAFGFMNQVVSYFLLRHQANQIQHEIAAIYKQNFPTTTTITQPRQHMQEKLTQLSEQTENNSFLGLLTKAETLLAENKDFKLQKIDYAHQQLKLTVTTATDTRTIEVKPT